MFWPVPGQIHTLTFHLFCVYVDDVVRLRVEPCRRCKFYLNQVTKKLSFLALSGTEKAVWRKLFVNLVCTLDFTHSSINMTWRLVIQGCLKTAMCIADES